MSFVHTAFGRGQIVGEETVRGRKQYLVAGNGFKLWVDEADAQIHTGAADFDFEPAEDVNEENSTDLPYNPKPQFPAEGFTEEQTIQPNHELDADERLSPADSLSFDSVGDREYPGPAEHLFAARMGDDEREERRREKFMENLERKMDKKYGPDGWPVFEDESVYGKDPAYQEWVAEKYGPEYTYEVDDQGHTSWPHLAGLSKDKNYPDAATSTFTRQRSAAVCEAFVRKVTSGPGHHFQSEIPGVPEHYEADQPQEFWDAYAQHREDGYHPPAAYARAFSQHGVAAPQHHSARRTASTTNFPDSLLYL